MRQGLFISISSLSRSKVAGQHLPEVSQLACTHPSPLIIFSTSFIILGLIVITWIIYMNSGWVLMNHTRWPNVHCLGSCKWYNNTQCMAGYEAEFWGKGLVVFLWMCKITFLIFVWKKCVVGHHFYHNSKGILFGSQHTSKQASCIKGLMMNTVTTQVSNSVLSCDLSAAVGIFITTGDYSSFMCDDETYFWLLPKKQNIVLSTCYRFKTGALRSEAADTGGM